MSIKDENDGHFWWCAVNTASTRCNCEADPRKNTGYYYQGEETQRINEAVGLFQRGGYPAGGKLADQMKPWPAGSKVYVQADDGNGKLEGWAQVGTVEESAPESVTTSQDNEASCVPAAKRADLLDEAKSIVSGPRAADYGPPEDNFRRIGEFWTTYLGELGMPTKIEAHDVAVMMILMKAARLIASPDHRDTWTDVAGYAACGYSTTEQPA